MCGCVFMYVFCGHIDAQIALPVAVYCVTSNLKQSANGQGQIELLCDCTAKLIGTVLLDGLDSYLCWCMLISNTIL